ncbi:MAG: aminodeoxychorismate/anthranilate synthase component II [Oscillospiraceae bacterium]|nr:aminodeoxychorismate/anthranilate synthase component II [Oscillospiraceae bacterium]
MILLVDNYDSFSYNLYQLIGAINPDIKVIRNDELSCEEALALDPSHIIISPGPGRPREAGICEELVLNAAGKVPVLGVCLGHQAICEAFGAKITYAKKLMHGKKSVIEYDRTSPMFSGIDTFLEVARYHSLAADESTMPDELKITARTNDGEIMAVEHKKYPVFGLQFHPESILTQNGRTIAENFLKIS